MKLLILLILLTSCSSLKRQQLYSGLTGALIAGTLGALIGKSLSPNEQSNKLNTAIGASVGLAVGAASGALLGTYFWQEDPRNLPLKPMIIEDEISKVMPPQIKYKTLLPKNLTMIPLKGELPAFLKAKVKKGHVLVFEIPEFEELTDQGVIYHERHQAFKYTIE